MDFIKIFAIIIVVIITVTLASSFLLCRRPRMSMNFTHMGCRNATVYNRMTR